MDIALGIKEQVKNKQQTLIRKKGFENYLGALSAFLYIISSKIAHQKYRISDMGNFVSKVSYFHTGPILREDT